MGYTIRFRYNKKTGKKDIIVDMDANDELLRHEHESEHRKIVRGLVGKEVEVERMEPSALPPPLSEEVSHSETLDNTN